MQQPKTSKSKGRSHLIAAENRNTRDQCFSAFAGLGACILLVSVLTACAERINLVVPNPPRYPQAAELKRVTVLPFEGRGGETLAPEIEAILGSVQQGGRNYFTLIERTRRDAVLGEMRLQGSPITDESTAIKVGKQVGAQGIYLGTVISASVNDAPYTSEVQRCVYQDRDGKCQQYRSQSVNCIKRTATFQFAPKLIAVETAATPYAGRPLGQAEGSGCLGSGQPVASGDSLLAQARQAALEEFRRDVTPYTTDVAVRLLSDKDGITSDIASKKLSSGIEFAKKRRMDRACQLWAEGIEPSPDSIALLYNLGVCAEVQGDFEEAKRRYYEADQRLTSPNEAVTSALERIESRIKGEAVADGSSKPSGASNPWGALLQGLQEGVMGLQPAK